MKKAYFLCLAIGTLMAMAAGVALASPRDGTAISAPQSIATNNDMVQTDHQLQSVQPAIFAGHREASMGGDTKVIFAREVQPLNTRSAASYVMETANRSEAQNTASMASCKAECRTC